MLPCGRVRGSLAGDLGEDMHSTAPANTAGGTTNTRMSLSEG